MDDLANLHEPKSVAALWADTRAAGFTMPSESQTCSLLRTLAATKPAGRFLELGTGSGLGAAWLLDGMDAQSTLITVDNDARFQHILQRHHGHDPRLTIVCEDGGEYLQSLQGAQFDFIFADTWPGKYTHLEHTLGLLKPSGLYVIDDMLPQANWPEGHAAKVAALIAHLEQRTDVRLTKLAWASGVIVVSKCAQPIAEQGK